MAVSGDIKENYIGLHLSTGESYTSMADRVSDPELLKHLDQTGRNANLELAKWLRTQKDDAETRKVMVDEPLARAEAERTAAAELRRDQLTTELGKTTAPPARTARGTSTAS